MDGNRDSPTTLAAKQRFDTAQRCTRQGHDRQAKRQIRQSDLYVSLFCHYVIAICLGVLNLCRLGNGRDSVGYTWMVLHTHGHAVGEQ